MLTLRVLFLAMSASAMSVFFLGDLVAVVWVDDVLQKVAEGVPLVAFEAVGFEEAAVCVLEGVLAGWRCRRGRRRFWIR